MCKHSVQINLKTAMLVASLWTCHTGAQAQVVFQFEASKNVTTTGTNLTWQSLSRAGTTQPPRLLADTADWQFKTQNGVASVVNVKGPGAWPMEFEQGTPAHLTVRHIVAVVRTQPNIQGMASIFTSTENFRVAGMPLNSIFSNKVARIDTGRYNGAAWKIDLVEGAPLKANATHLLEITFSHDLPLNQLWVGSDPGRPDVWFRGFQGEYLALTGWSEPPPPNVKDVVSRFLIQEHGLELPPPPFSLESLNLARSMGAQFGAKYGTRLLIW